MQARLLLTQRQLPPRAEHVLLLEHEQQSGALAAAGEGERTRCFLLAEDRERAAGDFGEGGVDGSEDDCEQSISEMDGNWAL